jgi:hypothetical protein
LAAEIAEDIVGRLAVLPGRAGFRHLKRIAAVEDLCDAALNHDARERAAFIAAACGDADSLRHEVEALLAHAQTAEGFLEVPIGKMAAHLLSDTHGARPV